MHTNEAQSRDITNCANTSGPRPRLSLAPFSITWCRRALGEALGAWRPLFKPQRLLSLCHRAQSQLGPSEHDCPMAQAQAELPTLCGRQCQHHLLSKPFPNTSCDLGQQRNSDHERSGLGNMPTIHRYAYTCLWDAFALSLSCVPTLSLSLSLSCGLV